MIKRGVMLGVCAVVSVLLTGCGGSKGAASGSPTTVEVPAGKTTTVPVTKTTPVSPAAQPVFEIVEVGLGPNGYVTLLNFTDQPQNLLGRTMCQGSDCASLPNVTVAPGARARVAVGDGKGLSDVVMKHASIGELKTSDGELAIFSMDKGKRRLVTFMEWGSTPHAHTADAIEEGLWLKGSYAPTAGNATRLYVKRGGLWVFDTRS